MKAIRKWQMIQKLGLKRWGDFMVLHDYPAPNSVNGWKAWYANGTINSEERNWDELPDGIQILMIYLETHRQIVSGDSLYFDPFGVGQPKEGWRMDYDKFLDLQGRAMQDEWKPNA